MQAAFAAAMLAATPETSGVYYVDDHFVPYAGAKPVGKGWNNKRGRAEKGRADTHVTTADGRAVCFVTGQPSGLSITLPKALAELAKAVPLGTPIMLGFDRGGAYPAVFSHCRDNSVHWVTYRRAPLAVPGMLPVLSVITVNGKTRTIAWTDEKTQLKDYGEPSRSPCSSTASPSCRSSPPTPGCAPLTLLGWLKSRWRVENYLKYASENYGIDAICDYLADIETNTKVAGNPARKDANAVVREAEKTLAAAERGLAVLLADPAITPAAKNDKRIPAAEREIAAARRQLGAAKKARDPSPPSCPPTRSTPRRRWRCCAPAGAACRWCSACWRTTPSTGYRTSSTPTCATMTNTAPLPGKPSSAAPPGLSPSPPTRSPSPSSSPPSPASPAPWPCSPTRSTPPRPPMPATPVPSPTRSPRARQFNTKLTAPSGSET